MKLDLGKILKSINKGERPSSDTLYVSSKNDARLKDYQDSLNLYKFAGSNNPSELKKLTESYYRLKEKNKQAPKATKSDKLGNITINEVYKKPVKTVVYKDTEAKKPERPVVNKKPILDTLYVDNPNDPRLIAYQDSLKLNRDYPIPPKGYEIDPYVFTKTVDYVIGKDAKGNDIIEVRKNKRPANEPIGYTSHNSKDSGIQFNKTTGKYQNFFNSKRAIYKKPERPVVYRRPEPDNQDIEEIKQEVLQAIQNKYEGNPIYSSTAGSGGPSALIGFENRGDTTFIKPEDFDRFAVPKYARQFIQSKSKKK